MAKLTASAGFGNLGCPPMYSSVFPKVFAQPTPLVRDYDHFLAMFGWCDPDFTLIARVQAGRLAGAAAIGVEAGKVISKYKTGEHFTVTITDDTLTVEWRQDQIDAEAALDGFCVLRTPVPASQFDDPGVVSACKNLRYAERDFRSMKSDDLDLRPVFHRLEERVRAHVLICMLACYLTWHLRRAWTPLTFTEENPPRRTTRSRPHAGRPAPRPRPPASAIRQAASTAASAG